MAAILFAMHFARTLLVALLLIVPGCQASWLWDAFKRPREHMVELLGSVPPDAKVIGYGTMWWLDGSMRVWHIRIPEATADALRARCSAVGGWDEIPLQRIPEVTTPPKEKPTPRGCHIASRPSAAGEASLSLLLEGSTLQVRWVSGS